MYFFYTALLAFLLTLTLPFWLVQMLRKGKYRVGLGERMGNVPARLRPTQANEDCVWIHAVSVGEVLAVGGLVSAFKQKFPEWRVVISTTTQTGQTLAREKYEAENVFYFPIDLPFAITPFLNALRPKLVVLAETEFWPNFLHLARKSGAKIAVVNARISDRSFPRYRSWRTLFQRILSNVDLFLTQSEVDKTRLVSIGADPGRVQMSGNLKFEIRAAQTSELVAQLRGRLAPEAKVIVAGSTVEGEESLVLAAFKEVLREHPKAVLVLAPRHPERFDGVAELLAQSAMTFWRRSAGRWSESQLSGGVFLLDTIGELASIYELADIAFVGGSLVPRGGHNILEPAQFGKAIVVGPHTENFRDVIQIFSRDQAVLVSDADKLGALWLKLLNDPVMRREFGERAKKVMDSQSGTTQRTLDALEVLLWMPQSLRERRQVQA